MLAAWRNTSSPAPHLPPLVYYLISCHAAPTCWPAAAPTASCASGMWATRCSPACTRRCRAAQVRAAMRYACCGCLQVLPPGLYVRHACGRPWCNTALLAMMPCCITAAAAFACLALQLAQTRDHAPGLEPAVSFAPAVVVNTSNTAAVRNVQPAPSRRSRTWRGTARCSTSWEPARQLAQVR